MKGKGVDCYAVGKNIEEIYFSDGKICCMGCRKRRMKKTGVFENMICLLTYESLNHIDVLNEVGELCPLLFTEETKEEK